MSGSVEICGDSHLTVGDRLAYLWRNIARNLLDYGPAPERERFFSPRLAGTPGTASPSRVLTEAFLKSRLPRMLVPGRVRVLEIGCGSGSFCSLLAELGYSGEYVGLDVQDRFGHVDVPGFRRVFVCGDAHAFDPGEERFDLIVSVSTLEHIPDDARLIARLPGMLAVNGLELHFVPAGCGLLAYLWHGYRQYTLAHIAERFGAGDCIAISLGGLFSFLLHVTAITIGEMLLSLRTRGRFPGAYRWLLDYCLQFDRLIPVCPMMYAVRRSQGGRL